MQIVYVYSDIFQVSKKIYKIYLIICLMKRSKNGNALVIDYLDLYFLFTSIPILFFVFYYKFFNYFKAKFPEIEFHKQE